MKMEAALFLGPPATPGWHRKTPELGDSTENVILKVRLPALLMLFAAAALAAEESAAGDFAPNLVEAFVGATFDDGDGDFP
jgi:hypothetical protein